MEGPQKRDWACRAGIRGSGARIEGPKTETGWDSKALGSGMLRTAARNYGPMCWNLVNPWELRLGTYRNGVGEFWRPGLGISRNCYWGSDESGCL